MKYLKDYKNHVYIMEYDPIDGLNDYKKQIKEY